MTPGRVKAATVMHKAGQVREMLDGLSRLPLHDPQAFSEDPVVGAAAESYLRRALEALMDLGRHVLAKGFGEGPSEYKEIAVSLGRMDVLNEADAALMAQLAGYRNRMVHFYDEISSAELFEICAHQVGDVRRILAALLMWVRDNPERVDTAI
nr:DUF86 domain-containing protein [Actinomycetales bacterium]